MWPFTWGREKREMRVLVEFMTTTQELTIDDLRYKTNLPMAKLHATLERMEADGRLTSRYTEPAEPRAWMRRRLYKMKQDTGT
jgi:hypothetical protein